MLLVGVFEHDAIELAVIAIITVFRAILKVVLNITLHCQNYVKVKKKEAVQTFAEPLFNAN